MATAFSITTPATAPSTPPTLHHLPMEARTALCNARCDLADMAIDCLNMDLAAHARAIGRVLGQLRPALAQPAGHMVRGRLNLISAQLEALSILLTDKAAEKSGSGAPLPRVGGLSLDELGTRYAVFEMRLAVLIRSDEDETLQGERRAS